MPDIYDLDANKSIYMYIYVEVDHGSEAFCAELHYLIKTTDNSKQLFQAF